MAYDEGTGVALVQLFEQPAERALLRLGARVGRQSAAVEPAFVAYADGVGVVVPAVGADQIVRSSFLDRSVTTNDVVVANAESPALLPVPGVDLRRRTGLVGLHCRAVDDDEGDSTHDVDGEPTPGP